MKLYNVTVGNVNVNVVVHTTGIGAHMIEEINVGRCHRHTMSSQGIRWNMAKVPRHGKNCFLSSNTRGKNQFVSAGEKNE